MRPHDPSNDLRGHERIATEQTAELVDADGRRHPVALLNVSRGGSQVALAQETVNRLGARPGAVLGCRLWLPGDAEDDPLVGQATVAYVLAADAQGEARLGLSFEGLSADALERLEAFIATCLLYAE